MSIPNVIEADDIPAGSDEPHGLIYKIRNVVSNNKILNFVGVSTNATGQAGLLNGLIKWNGGWHSLNSPHAYAQVEFKNMKVFPTHYSLRGFSTAYYAKEWYLYGLNSENEEPTLLSTGTNAGNDFCLGCSGSACCNDNWATFAMNPTYKSFRYFRIKCKTSTSSSYPYRIALKGFEVFGKLVKETRGAFCFKSYPKSKHLPTYAFFRLLSIFLI